MLPSIYGLYGACLSGTLAVVDTIYTNDTSLLVQIRMMRSDTKVRIHRKGEGTGEEVRERERRQTLVCLCNQHNLTCGSHTWNHLFLLFDK